MSDSAYIHGTAAAEQTRLAAFNDLVNESFLDFLDFNGAKSILEVGSGLGVLTSEVARRFPGANVTGIEVSESQLARAKEHSLPNLQFVQGDATQLPFDEAEFDVVYCRWVLEHLTDPSAALTEILRVLKPGGRLFIDEVDVSSQRYDPPTPGFNVAWRAVTQLQKKLGGDNQLGTKLPRLLRAAGFFHVTAVAEPAVYQSGTGEFSTWVGNERAIIEGCAEELRTHKLLNDDEMAAAFAELDDLKNRPDATSWYCWFRASGTSRRRELALSSQSVLALPS